MRSRLIRVSVLSSLALALMAGLWTMRPVATQLEKSPARPPAAPITARADNTVAPVAVKTLVPEGMTVMGSEWAEPEGSELQVFTRWAGTYMGAAPTEKEALLVEGVRLAGARRAVVKRMIQEDPEGALAAAVPVMVRKQLPAEIVSLLEERVSGQGELALVAVTPVPGQTVAEPVFRSALVNEKEYRAYTYGKRAKVNSLASASIIGVALDGKLAVSESPVRLLEPGETPDGRLVNEVCEISGITTPVSSNEPLNTTVPVAVEARGQVDVLCSPAHVPLYAARLEAAERPGSELPMANDQPGTSTVVGRPAVAWTHGTKKLLIIRVDFSDKVGTPLNPADSNQPITDAYAVNLINNANGVRDFYEQGSYGKTSVTIEPVSGSDSPDVTAVLRMPKTASYYATNYAVLEMHAAARALAQAGGVVVDSYDRVGVVFSHLGSFSSLFSFAGLGNVESKHFWINGHYTFYVVAHEIGHNYGLQHSALWQVTDGNPVSPAGTSVEYGDVYDIMGSGQGVDNHFSHWNKAIMQWIPDSAVSVANTGGTYRVYRFDHQGANTANPLALKVVRNRSMDYWIGYRRATTNASMDGGAYLLWGYNDNQFGRLLDMTTPGTSVTDAGLAVGSTFTDTATGITLQPVAQGGTGADEWLDVQVTIQPRISWSLAKYTVNEQGGSAVLTATRTNNSTGAISVNFATSNGTATSPADYVSQTGSLAWASGDMAPKTVTIAVVPDALVEGTQDFNVTLSGITGGVIINNPAAVVTLADPGAKDPGMYSDFIDATVRKVLVLPDGRILAGGHFKLTQDIISSGTQYPRGGIAMFSEGGRVDTLFASDGGIYHSSTAPLDYSNYVKDIARQPDGKFVVVGQFAYMHSTVRGNIARLNADGTLDPSFASGAGANGSIEAVLVLPDGKIVIGGRFTTYNGTAREYLARLNADGTLDSTFVGPDFSDATGWRVMSLAMQSDGKVLVGGNFYLWNGTDRRSGICRVLSTGTLDSSFNGVVQGAHIPGDASQLRPVEKIVVRPDGTIYIGGSFTAYNNVSRGGLVRLLSTGALDPAFTTSTNGVCNTLLLQPDEGLILGGTFTHVGGLPSNKLGRVSSLGVVDTAFAAPGGPTGIVYDLALQPDGRVVMVGDVGDYQGNALIDAAPLWRFFAGLPGLPGTLQVTSESLAGVEGTSATVTVSRTGGTSGSLLIGYATVAGTASTSDFTPTSGTLSWANGDGASKTITIPVTTDAIAEIGEVFTVNLAQPAVGAVILGTVQRTLVTVNSAFDTWRDSYFTEVESANPAISGDQADIDFDGVPNLMEFAFNLSPKTADVAGLPATGKVNVSGSDYLTVTFKRRVPALDLVYTPQTNASLPGTWVANAVQVGSAVNNGDGTETVVFRDAVPVAPGVERFMRVMVVRAP